MCERERSDQNEHPQQQQKTLTSAITEPAFYTRRPCARLHKSRLGHRAQYYYHTDLLAQPPQPRHQRTLPLWKVNPIVVRRRSTVFCKCTFYVFFVVRCVHCTTSSWCMPGIRAVDAVGALCCANRRDATCLWSQVCQLENIYPSQGIWDAQWVTWITVGKHEII